MTFGVYTRQIPDELIGAVRSAIIATSILGIVLGVIAVVWPSATTIVLAVLFGISLIITGIFRIYQAFAATFIAPGWRILLGILGFAILALGIIALFHPGNAVWLLALFIGVGWIFQGVGDLYAAVTKSGHAPTWFLVLSGIIGVLAGIAMISLGGVGVDLLVLIGGIFLIVISIASLFTLPKKVDATV
ncbi:DUF308 domain-containing protein [Gordonia sp. VNQ95]|jgi:uncharacterized membrane protein HdeD (DUF308 family)|uniref:HdeD family acid-resistance protein n=1 Tax=Gordonia TaxID=2053 RepID=UPI0032B6058C